MEASHNVLENDVGQLGILVSAQKEYIDNFAVGYKDDCSKIEGLCANLAKVNEQMDTDICSLNGSKMRHRKEINRHYDTLQMHENNIKSLKSQVKDLVKVVNSQTNRIRELQEAVDANDNIIKNQQEWIAKMRGKEYRCGDIDPFLAMAKLSMNSFCTDIKTPSRPTSFSKTLWLDSKLSR